MAPGGLPKFTARLRIKRKARLLRLKHWILRRIYRKLRIWSPSRTMYEGRPVTPYGDPIETEDEQAHLHAACDIRGTGRALQRGIGQRVRAWHR
jgi:hypothetical protein